MIGNSTKFNKINSRKRRKPPIHLTPYRGWEYSWLRRSIKTDRAKILWRRFHLLFFSVDYGCFHDILHLPKL